MTDNNTFNGLSDACERFNATMRKAGITADSTVSIIRGKHVYSISAREESKPIVYDKGQTLLVVRRGR